MAGYQGYAVLPCDPTQDETLFLQSVAAQLRRRSTQQENHRIECGLPKAFRFDLYPNGFHEAIRASERPIPDNYMPRRVLVSRRIGNVRISAVIAH
jgi:hypothetical protein